MLEYSLEHHLILLTLGGSGPYFMPGSINAKTEHTHTVLIEQSDLLHRRRAC